MTRRSSACAVAVMDEARTLWIDQAAAAKWRLNIPGARGCLLDAARAGQARPGYDDEGAGRPHRRRLHRDAAQRIPALSRRPRHGRRAAPGRRSPCDLVTNGASATGARRRSSGSATSPHRFDHIQIEGEFRPGQARARGLPARALERLGVRAGRRLDGRRQLRMGSWWPRRSSACAACGTTRSRPACRRMPRPSRRASSNGWANWLNNRRADGITAKSAPVSSRGPLQYAERAACRTDIRAHAWHRPL